MTNPVTNIKLGNIGIISINYPPVNALSQSVRQGLINGIRQFEQNEAIQAIIIRCEQRTFIAGADIKEFGSTPLEPHLPDVVNYIEACSKPVIASLFGTSLGGGFEVALACHFRVALPSAKIGLPEVNLGLLPGAGGTQRLPRMIGTNKAIEMIAGGRHYPVSDFSSSDLIDAIFCSEGNLDNATVEFAHQIIEKKLAELPRVGDREIVDDVEDWPHLLAKINKKSRGKEAPNVVAQLVHDTRKLSVLEGMKLERTAFITLKESEQSKALRYAFGAERQAAKTDFSTVPLNVKTVGIIGGGTMGSGIATAFLSSGLNLVLIEQNDKALSLGKTRIEKNFSSNVKRGRMSQSQVDSYLVALNTSVDYQDLSNCDLVIEAVFENMEVKKTIFKQFDQVCKSDCILATNTSYLDIDEIANVVKDPSRVIGMHFFSPANIMKLLEVVQAKESSEQALVTAMAIAKKLKKVSVLVGVCFGFAGNRMYTRYGREVQQMLLEGAKVSQIDKALTNWGMAMGPLAVADMSGIDIGVHARRSQPFPDFDKGYFKPAELMFEQARFGRKTGSGYYQYDDNGHLIADPVVDSTIAASAAALAITQQEFTEEDIVKRALCALISEGLQLLNDGIVQRASDIDVIWLHGYGFPRHKGGPMFHAKKMGIEFLEEIFREYADEFGVRIWPKVNLNILD